MAFLGNLSLSTLWTNIRARIDGPQPDRQSRVVRRDVQSGQRVLAATPTLNIALQNQTNSGSVYAYVTGQAIDSSNALFLLQTDGFTPYYPDSPPSIGTPLAVNCAIALGAPGNTVNVTIPHIAGGRIWFSVDTPLTFLLNPGPALVEPSVSNPTDPNINISWGFAEFTFNNAQLFANISYVDFVCLPISLTLTNASGSTQHVSGMPADGLAAVCAGLQAQTAVDGAGWSSLIVNSPDGRLLRALSPNNGIMLDPSLFSGYYQPYVDQVWARYSGSPLAINTQAQWGTQIGQVQSFSNELTFSDEAFAQPSTADIFSCSTGPFASGADAERGALTARLAAGFNRSTLLISSALPADVPADQYYRSTITNHYSRIVHAANLDGRGYAFPYDDVAPDGAADQSGAVYDGEPALLTVAVGGNNAYV